MRHIRPTSGGGRRPSPAVRVEQDRRRERDERDAEREAAGRRPHGGHHGSPRRKGMIMSSSAAILHAAPDRSAARAEGPGTEGLPFRARPHLRGRCGRRRAASDMQRDGRRNLYDPREMPAVSTSAGDRYAPRLARRLPRCDHRADGPGQYAGRRASTSTRRSSTPSGMAGRRPTSCSPPSSGSRGSR